MNKPQSPIEIQKYIKDIHFPANKNDIISQMKKNNAPDEIIQFAEKLEEKKYSNPTDISKEFSKHNQDKS